MKALLGILAGLVAALTLYPLLRIGGFLWGHEANPATMLYQTHSGYFWRLWTCAYAGALVACIAASIAKPAHLRLLQPMLYAAVGLLVFQAVVAP